MEKETLLGFSGPRGKQRSRGTNMGGARTTFKTENRVGRGVGSREFDLGPRGKRMPEDVGGTGSPTQRRTLLKG